jgi:hypothetical protein
MFKAVRDNTKRKSLNLCLGLFRGTPISEDSGQINHFCNPTTVFLSFNFHAKLHVKKILRLSAMLEKAPTIPI